LNVVGILDLLGQNEEKKREDELKPVMLVAG
jgi:hypothetical protein